MNTEILRKVKDTTDELISILSSFSQPEINKIPPGGGWSAAQVGDHLFKSYGVVDILTTPVKKTDRAPDEKIVPIKNTFLNFDIKMNSPEFIIPSAGTLDKVSLIDSLKDRTLKIIQISEPLDLSETCLAFSLPGLGELTRLEWLHFIMYHTQRHIQQLRNIQQKVIRDEEEIHR